MSSIGMVLSERMPASATRDWRPPPLGPRDLVVQKIDACFGNVRWRRSSGSLYVNLPPPSGPVELRVSDEDPVTSIYVRGLDPAVLGPMCHANGWHLYDARSGDFVRFESASR